MVKLMEDGLKLTVTEKDKKMVEDVIKNCQDEYGELMSKETGREYKCTLALSEGKALQPETDCGGVTLASNDGRIVCNNTVMSKLMLAYEELLPDIRALLFPNK